MEHFSGFFEKGFGGIYSTAGMVCISYAGLTNVASISEEVKDPEKNLWLAMLYALITAIIVYGLGTFVIVGVLPPEMLHNNLTPVTAVGKVIFGRWGEMIMAVAAVLAFFAVSNAAILSASRYPLAMGRDQLLPGIFCKLSKNNTPKYSIYITVVLILLCLTFLNPIKITKLASAFQLLLFALSCLAVIIMRESKIESYDPGFRTPLYPWLQIFGVIAPFFLIIEMGVWPLLFTAGLIAISTIWYFYYARDKVVRDGAIYHVFERLGARRFEGLDRELRGILVEKGLRKENPYDVVIARASLIDLNSKVKFEDVVRQASVQLSKRVPASHKLLTDVFMQGTRVGATPVTHGIALPHLRLPDIKQPEIVLVRSKKGTFVDVENEFLKKQISSKPVHAFFFLVSSEENPGQHLRILAQIAGRVDKENFMTDWLTAKNEQQLKEILLRDECFLSLRLKSDHKTSELIGKKVRDLDMPEGSLIAIIHRNGKIIIPKGRTVLKKGDQLTIIGGPAEIKELVQKYGDGDKSFDQPSPPEN